MNEWTSPEQRLEHRLSKIEAGIEALRAEVKRMADSVALQNGRISLLEEGKVHAERLAAHAAGLIEGRSGLRRGEIALLLGFVSIAGTLSGIVVSVLAAMQ